MMWLRKRTMSAVIGVVFVALVSGPGAAVSQESADTHVLVSPTSSWSVWLDFHPDQIDPQVAKKGLDDLLSERGQERISEEATAIAQGLGVDTQAPGFDWRDHLYVLWEPYLSSYAFPVPLPNGKGDRSRPAAAIASPSVAKNWMKPGFDEAGWVTRPSPAQMGDPADPIIKQLRNLQPSTTNVRAAYYRTYFEAVAGGRYILDLTYRGGLRVFVNGHEVLRENLQEGLIGAQTRAKGYDRAWVGNGKRDTGGWLNRRVVGFVLPQDAVADGPNVLAIETRSPYLNPQALTAERRMGHGADAKREFVVAPAHTGIVSVSLAGPSPKRSIGLEVWTASIHHRVHSQDPPPAAAPQRPLQIVGPRNGRFAAMFVMRSPVAVEQLRFRVDPLSSPAGQIGPENVSLRAMVSAPANSETLRWMGNHRGLSSLGGNHREFDALTRWRYRGQAGRDARFFDELAKDSPSRLDAGAVQPVWVEVHVPKDAVAGRYQGAVVIEASGHAAVRVPLFVDVLDWSLPDARDFSTDVWVEQSPYGLAKQAGVELWSDAHFRLIDQSFAQIGRLGGDFVHIPVLQFTEFGNQEDSPIRWQQKDNQLRADFTIGDRYLDLAIKHLGKPRVISFGVMQGGGGQGRGKNLMKNITTIPLADGGALDLSANPNHYKDVARAIYEHMRVRGLADVMHWGLPWDFPPQPELPALLEQVAPKVGWVRAGHCDQGTPKWVTVLSEVWPSWPNRPEGAIHVLNPRRHSPSHLLEGYFSPFAFRIFPIRASFNGYTGIGRIGADYGDSWGEGNTPQDAVPDFGIKNLLWVREGAVNSSQRLEILREGLQEDQAWRYLKQALDSGVLPHDMSEQVHRTLESYLRQTAHLQAVYFGYHNPAFHDHDQDWQSRSLALFELAGQVSRIVGSATP